MRFGIPHRRRRPRRVADENGVLSGAELLEEREPVARPGFDVVGERAVNDAQTECRELTLQPREPYVTRGTAPLP